MEGLARSVISNGMQRYLVGMRIQLRHWQDRRAHVPTDLWYIHRAQIGPGAHPTSYPEGAKGSLPGNKAAGA
jgi:hypothetical protein